MTSLQLHKLDLSQLGKALVLWSRKQILFHLCAIGWVQILTRRNINGLVVIPLESVAMYLYDHLVLL